MSKVTKLYAGSIQNDIWEYLLTGNRITAVQSMNLFGCTSNTFVTRVNELIRDFKFPIMKHNETKKTKRSGRIAVYKVYYVKDGHYHKTLITKGE